MCRKTNIKNETQQTIFCIILDFLFYHLYKNTFCLYQFHMTTIIETSNIKFIFQNTIFFYFI